ncbi:hypothetical protein CAP35_03410 [Chitinophagaceae bacterium IBVUCB1]|nr:hypothetical protein CAP35_03410 [Chitinophagaceae bacterium IBVUCB1]
MTENQQTQNFNQPQIALPNATAVLILGIISIVLCCCYGGGLILGIIALVLASKDMKRYLANPAMYTAGSFSNLKAGRICAIIAVALSAVYILFYIWLIVTFGWAAMQDPDAMREVMENWMK